MGQRIVGQPDPWFAGCGMLLAIITTGIGLLLVIFWLSWPR